MPPPLAAFDDEVDQLPLPSSEQLSGSFKLFPSASVLPSPETNEQPKRERHVTFAETKTVHEVLHIRNYTPTEIYLTWYDHNDFFRIYNDCQEILRRCCRQNRMNSPEMRGLEAANPLAFYEKKNIRLDAVYFILSEQERQRRIGRKDPFGLKVRIYSATCTADSREHALDIAENDAIEAQDIYNEYDFQTEDDFEDDRDKCKILFNISNWFSWWDQSVFVDSVEAGCVPMM